MTIKPPLIESEMQLDIALEAIKNPAMADRMEVSFRETFKALWKTISDQKSQISVDRQAWKDYSDELNELTEAYSTRNDN